MVSAVVVCGGSGRRFGADKLAADLHGHSLLDRVLEGLPAEWAIVAVGPTRPTVRPVSWTREAVPGAGPLAATAAGMALVRTTVAVIVAGDMPYAGGYLPSLVAALTSAPDGVDGVVAVDAGGRRQNLLCALRTERARGALPTDVEGAAMRRLLDALHLRDLPLPPAATLDVDTRDDLDQARLRSGDEGDHDSPAR